MISFFRKKTIMSVTIDEHSISGSSFTITKNKVIPLFFEQLIFEFPISHQTRLFNMPIIKDSLISICKKHAIQHPEFIYALSGKGIEEKIEKRDNKASSDHAEFCYHIKDNLYYFCTANHHVLFQYQLLSFLSKGTCPFIVSTQCALLHAKKLCCLNTKHNFLEDECLEEITNKITLMHQSTISVEQQKSLATGLGLYLLYQGKYET